MSELELEDAIALVADAIARAARDLGNGGAATPFGAIEAHSMAVLEAAEKIASAITYFADALTVAMEQRTP